MISLAIIGGGPAGLSAGLYATRGGIKDVVLFERGMPGGQIINSSEIENYPGVKEVVSGIDFMEPWQEQCFRFGLIHNMNEVIRVSKNGKYFDILLADGKIEQAKSVIVCTGGTPRRSGIKGETEFWGKGVSVCATCDGFFYKNKDVAVLGGGDTALEEAIYLTRMCNKVYLIHRRNEFRAAPITIEHVKNNPKIEVVTPNIIDEIIGSNSVNAIKVTNIDTKESKDIKVDGLFVFVGYDVNTSVLMQENNQPLCDLTSSGHVKVDLNMKTSIEGLFAAGDLRESALKQVVIAAGDGAVAALNAIEYLESTK
ncbi:thioredoxin-disulfide reductase [Helicobacter sp. MIT 14-3879]|uniref:thioredoxin-disulfide reductase n=1 Tax=Helicobacter sp. MIT 14-3879 TaxID=2040649 RepID=UPI000E1E9569|nr:thioredoxin-disulfide reductase [Helicobacter sp. MIT 14-3879]RDU63147.1 thioredoxin-disulfide reductase [Helicobacter sp. MIT 14-3879]